jgi:hypothetical protein
VSTEFKKLLSHWSRSYPNIESDVQKAFSEITENILACRGRLVIGGPRFDVYKFRQKSSNIPRGSSYGLRIIALHDRRAGIMYPIIAYPKPVWDDVDNATIYNAVRELKLILGHCTSPECDGDMTPVYPQEIKVVAEIPQIKLRCEKCKSVNWREYIAEQ